MRLSTPMLRFCLFSLVAMLCGCIGPGVDAYRIQSARSNILEEFSDNPIEATRKYRALWDSGQLDDSDLNTARKLVIAGELMEKDRISYSRYFEFVQSKTDAENSQVQSLAIAALANAKGIESIDAILAKVNSPSPDIATEAISALEFRHDHASATPALFDDAEHLKIESKRLCSTAVRQRRSQLHRFCVRLGM